MKGKRITIFLFISRYKRWPRYDIYYSIKNRIMKKKQMIFNFKLFYLINKNKKTNIEYLRPKITDLKHQNYIKYLPQRRIRIPEMKHRNHETQFYNFFAEIKYHSTVFSYLFEK